MINKDKMKGMLVAIGTKGNDSEPSMDESDLPVSNDKAHVELAGKLISAIKQDNPELFAKHFNDFVYLCQEGESGEEEGNC